MIELAKDIPTEAELFRMTGDDPELREFVFELRRAGAPRFTPGESAEQRGRVKQRLEFGTIPYFDEVHDFVQVEFPFLADDRLLGNQYRKLIAEDFARRFAGGDRERVGVEVKPDGSMDLWLIDSEGQRVSGSTYNIPSKEFNPFPRRNQ